MKAKVTERTVRDEILEYISDHPGTSFSAIQRAFRMNDGTLRYHLDHLRKDDKIKQTDKGERKYYSLEGSCRRRVEGLSDDQNRVLSLIKAHPGISSYRIREMTGLGREETKYIIRKLKERKFIYRTGPKGDPRYEYISNARLADEMMAIIMERSVKGEMDWKTFEKLKARIEDLKVQ